MLDTAYQLVFHEIAIVDLKKLKSCLCHLYWFKRDICYSQVLGLNRICSDNFSFVNRCNDLEGWLVEIILEQIISK